MIIYKTTNLINGKIYIGQDKNNNPNYYGSGKLLKSAIGKYGKKNFKKEILEVCASVKDLDDREVFWIDKLGSKDLNIGYNISDGGKEGDRQIGHDIAKEGIYNYWVRKHGIEVADLKKEEKINKIRKHNTNNGTKLTKKGRYAIWIEKYGEEEALRRHSEWRVKVSQVQQRKLQLGWTHTEEARRKISEARKGRKLTEETKEKLRKPKPAGFGKKLSEKTKGIPTGRASVARRAVQQFDLNDTFIRDWESIKQAENTLKIFNISSVCKGKQTTAGGYKWKYKKDKEHE